MPKLSQLMVRSALLWLGVGYTLGGLALLQKGLGPLPWLWTLRLSHVHVLLVGWLVQLACGVAFWILPRLDAAGSRGDERPVWLCYAALNSGVLLAALQLPLAPLFGTGATRWMPIMAALLYLLASGAFLINAWPRVLPFRNLPRPGYRVTSDEG